MSKTRQRLVTLFTIIGVITTGVCILIAMAMSWRCMVRETVAERTVLELHLDRALGTDGAEDPLEAVLGERRTTVQEVIEALERGAHDDRVVGVLAYVDGTPHGMARVEELRDAVLAFRASGKRAVVFAETLGDMGPGTQGYYLATAFDEIYLQPTGMLGLTGLRSERMYYRGTLDKLEIEPNGDRRSEYKSAFDRYTARHMSEAEREQLTAMLGDLHALLVDAIAGRTGDDPAAAREAIEQGPYLAAEAHELGLVDGLLYRDQVLASMEEAVGPGIERLYVGPYLERAGRPWQEGTVIAVIHGVGIIGRGSSAYDSIEGRAMMGSETVTTAFRSAIEDPEVVAIVFRVDSPGGSVVASEAIWRSTQMAREAGKPVVVSMGNYAASGGYYVSAGATAIVAQPSTLTGSIGVFAGKPVTSKLLNKLGITWDTVQTSSNANVWSSLERYDAEGWQGLQDTLDTIYADFKEHVAQGRGLSEMEVEALARGRVWTGVRAKELGLVDALGGLHTAIALAREHAELSADEPIELRTFPAPQSLWTRLLGDGPANSDGNARARVEVGLARWRAIAAQLRAVEMASGEAGVLVAEPVTVQ